MQILLIYAHPSKNSFTFQIYDRIIKGLHDSVHVIEVSDLYAINFNSDMTEEEYKREGFSNLSLPIPDDVQKEQDKLDKAECVIFIYPVWWSDCPSKLKGWFDRVFSVGYAYGYDENSSIKKMKTIKQGLVICTAGHPNDYLNEIGISQSMRKIMIDDRLGERFEKKDMIIFGGTLDLVKVKDRHLSEAYEIGKEIENYFA